MALLKRLVREHLASQDVPATQLRMLVLARLAKHGKLDLPASEAGEGTTADLLGRYPDGLSEMGGSRPSH